MKTAIILSLAIFASQSFAFTFDSNVPEKTKALFLSDIGYVYAIEGNQASSLHKQVFGNVNGADYKNYLETRIKNVGVSDCGTGHSIACLNPMEPTTLYLDPKYVPGIEPAMARIGIYFNIARHAETDHGNWMNATCPTPFLDFDGKEMKSPFSGLSMAGEDACDNYALGPYGSAAILLKNISKYCTNCSLQDKADAKNMVPYFLIRVIDQKARELVISDGR